MRFSPKTEDSRCDLTCLGLLAVARLQWARSQGCNQRFQKGGPGDKKKKEDEDEGQIKAGDSVVIVRSPPHLDLVHLLVGFSTVWQTARMDSRTTLRLPG